MKRVMSISEIVDSHQVANGTRDVIATGEATYDEARCELTMELAGRVIVTDAHEHDTAHSVDWLPKPETIREHVSREETQPLARELFHRWTAKVRAGLPSPAAQPT